MLVQSIFFVLDNACAPQDQGHLPAHLDLSKGVDLWESGLAPTAQQPERATSAPALVITPHEGALEEPGGWLQGRLC